MRTRCIWTGERTDEVVAVTARMRTRFGTDPHEATFYVQPRHEAALRAYLDRFARFGGWFMAGLAAYAAVAVLVSVLAVLGVLPEPAGVTTLGVLTVALGVALHRLPFATPETVAMFGLRRSVRLARAGGVLVAASGLGLLGLSFIL